MIEMADARESCRQASRIGRVHDNRLDVRPEFLSRQLQPVAVATGNGDGVAVGQEPACACETDAGRAADDDDMLGGHEDLSVENEERGLGVRRRLDPLLPSQTVPE